MISMLLGTLLTAVLEQCRGADEVHAQVSKLEEELSEVPQTAFGAKSNPAYQTFLSMEPSLVPDYLLVAVLISGATSRNPVAVARDLLASTGGYLDRIDDPDLVHQLSGVGDAARARLLASAELNRRIDYHVARRAQKEPITNPQQVFDLARSLARGHVEYLGAIFLDNRNQVVGTRILSRGTDRFTIVDPAEVIRQALNLRARGIILVHQHPTGTPEPSTEDIQVTEAVHRAARTMGLSLLDHIVVGGNQATSLAMRGHIPGGLRQGPVVLK